MKQKNVHFRKIPDHINQEMSRIQSQYIVVAAIIEATKDDIVKGEYRNVGIKMEKGAIVVPETLFSEDINGIYARRNRNGIVWKLKELPKVTKTIWWESPNFGDPNKGYHSNYRDIEVYQRRFEPPRDWEFSISIISENDTRVRIKAEINSVLNRKEKYFQADLFFAINLLQEQFRDCHVFDASTKDEDIAKVVIVGWEIFPPGTSDNTISAISRRVRNQNPIRQREIQKRVEALEQLHPKEYILGRGMNSKYFGASPWIEANGEKSCLR